MAPTSTRSSSTSSASTSSSKSTLDGIKKFGCGHPGCGKSFSRSEHLHRHALNHKDGNNTCLRCSAHFRRRDLLDRHMARHKEKDDEAGGEGLGILATRKRLWRDAEGNIVNARRPSHAQEGAKRRQIYSPARKPSTASNASTSSSLLSGLSSPQIPMSQTSSLASPTISVDTGAPGYHSRSLGPKSESSGLYQDSWLSIAQFPPPSVLIFEHSQDSQSLSNDNNEGFWPVMHNCLTSEYLTSLLWDL